MERPRTKPLLALADSQGCLPGLLDACSSCSVLACEAAYGAVVHQILELSLSDE